MADVFATSKRAPENWRWWTPPVRQPRPEAFCYPEGHVGVFLTCVKLLMVFYNTILACAGIVWSSWELVRTKLVLPKSFAELSFKDTFDKDNPVERYSRPRTRLRLDWHQGTEDY